jgi:hypothetical protein
MLTVGRRRLDGSRSEAEAFRRWSGSKRAACRGWVLMLKPRLSMFLLAEIGDGDGSSLIWTEQKGA